MLALGEQFSYNLGQASRPDFGEYITRQASNYAIHFCPQLSGNLVTVTDHSFLFCLLLWFQSVFLHTMCIHNLWWARFLSNSADFKSYKEIPKQTTRAARVNRRQVAAYARLLKLLSSWIRNSNIVRRLIFKPENRFQAAALENTYRELDIRYYEFCNVLKISFLKAKKLPWCIKFPWKSRTISTSYTNGGV